MCTPERPALRAANRSRRGQAAIAILFWAGGILLFVAPFLRAPSRPAWDAPDRTRITSSEDEEAVLDIPFAEDLAHFDEVAREEGWDIGSLKVHLEAASEHHFGSDSDALRDSGLVDLGRLESGARVYARYCAGCHAPTGDGGGPAASFLSPRPRNFRRGIFKFTSTGSGSRPLRSDLFRTVTRGLSGASMPSFALVPEELRRDVVEYVRYLSIRGEFEQLMLDLAWEEEELPDAEEAAEIVESRWSDERLRPLFPTVEEPPDDTDSVARGRELFLEPSRATCFTCHGEGGRGDGPNADAYTDAWGYPIRPRDLTRGVFRAGVEGRDLWLTIAHGIGGTPMPGYLGALSGEEIWHLVHYVQALADGEAPASEGD